jgi:hypothetical protein
MGRKKAKPNYRRIVLRLPDLDHSKLAVLNSLTSPNSRRVYQHAIEKFIAWYCSEPRLAFNRIVLVRYRIHWSRAHWQRTRSTSTSRPCGGWHMRRPMPACSAPTWPRVSLG